MPRARHHLVVSLVTGLLLALGAQSALGSSALYWTNSSGNSIGTASLDGTGARPAPITGADYPRGIAVAPRAGYVYWANNSSNTIGRARLDGSGSEASFITGANGPSGVAVDDTYVYWANTGNGTISRARLDGTDLDANFIGGGNTVTGVAVDSGHVYWGNYGTDRIGRANLDGSGVDQSFIASGPEPHGVAVSGTHIYWTNYTTGPRIGRANLDGTGVDAALIPLPGLLFYLDADDTHVYWANAGTNSVGRANLDGTGVDNNLVTGGDDPFAVAAASWLPAAQPSGDGAFGDLTTGSVSTPRTITLTSMGDGPLAVGAAAISGSGADQFRVVSDTCSGRTLAIGATCSVAASFAPTADGAAAANLTIPSDAGNSPATHGLSGTGVPAKAPSPAPAAPGPPGGTFGGARQSGGNLSRATITAHLDGPGTLSITARATVGGRSVALGATSVTTSAAGTVEVPLTLPAAVRTRLAQAGRVPVDLVWRSTGPNGVTMSVSPSYTRLPSLLAAPSAVLSGQWIGRTLGPWARAPRLTGARRTALAITRRGDAFEGRVVR